MSSASVNPLPALPYAEWEETKATLHLVTQIVGKIKLAHHPKLPHWWHATLHVTPRGLSTQTIPTDSGNFEIELNIPNLTLHFSSSRGKKTTVSLEGRSVANVYKEVMEALETIDHPTKILAKPYDTPHSDIPFADDTVHRSWDRNAINSWWETLIFVDGVFKHFAGASFARTSPVHLFWHSFDFVVSRFSGQANQDKIAGSRRSDAEAYSHEVISFGFWPGDPKVQFPAFYSYTAPEPKNLASSQLQPKEAWWQDLGPSHLALLKYDDLRQKPNPRQALLSFMQSAYEAGCHCAQWEEYQANETSHYWEKLDEKFPLTRNKETRIVPASANGN